MKSLQQVCFIPDHYNPGEPKAIDEFEAHVNHLHSNSDYLFSQEYAAVTPDR